MFYSIYNLIYDFVSSFVNLVVSLFDGVFDDRLGAHSFNIYLFSDAGWFSEPIYLVDLFSLIAGVFIVIFLIRLLWKGTKKFINMVFGVFKL